ncbi:MAG: toxin-antitoxin system, toxin component [bacterium]|nr:toxin-antitoxin system, toxin component [bacterium]
MPLNLLIDESVDYRIVKGLKGLDLNIKSVAELSKGIPDNEVLELSRKVDSILVTEDRDFGEWVFAYQEKNVSVVYLRYKVQDLNKIIDSLIKVLSDRGQNLYGKFVVITINKIRTREIL